MKPILFGLVLSLALLGCGKEKEPTAKSSVPEKSPAVTAAPARKVRRGMRWGWNLFVITRRILTPESSVAT